MPGDFFDSNILIYTASSEATKRERATRLVAGGGWVSVQVLNEVTQVARRKMGYDWPRTFAFLATLRALVTVRDVTLADHDRGLAIAYRHKLQVYDAVIVATALATGADRFYSEDMHDGLILDGRLRIVNPFLA